MLTDEEGVFLSQRKIPEMARLECQAHPNFIELSMDGDTLRIDREDLDLEPFSVKVWEDEFSALDLGDTAAIWLRSRFGKAIRLVHYDQNTPRIRNKSDVEFKTSFADGYPILITNTGSLTQLNDEMPEPVPMDRFRPNIVVSGLEAWLEQKAISVRVGDAESDLLKACLRCNVTRIDQQTGRPGGVEPLQTLVRRGDGEAVFGVNVVLPTGIRLEVGQQIQWILPDQELR